LWSGSPIDLSHLRVFGCTAYAHIPSQKRQKLDARAKALIFVGYGENFKGYRFIDPSSPHKVIKSRSVTFIEDSFIGKHDSCKKICGTNFYNYYIDKEHFNTDLDFNNDLNINEIEQDKTKEKTDKSAESSPTCTQISDAESPTPPAWSPLSERYCTGDEGANDSPGDEDGAPLGAVSSLPESSLDSCDEGDEDGAPLGAVSSLPESPPSEPTLPANPDTSRSRPVRKTRGNVPDYLKAYDLSMVAEGCSPDEPTSYNEAMQSLEKEYWQNAMQSEYDSLIKNNVWTLVDRPTNENVVKCKWVYKKKLDTSGKPSKFKARLVARGFSQVEGIDYTDTFAPVVRHSTLRILFSIATELELEIDHIDVTTAFLNGELNEKIYMEQPSGFKNCDKVCLLNKSLYGLKQASRMWNIKIHDFLAQNNFTQSKCEPCIYTKKTKTEFIIIALYVDDFYIFHNNCIHNFLQLLQANFEVRYLGKLNNCLGINVYRQKGITTLDQTEYIKRLLVKYGMSECKPVSTPLPVNCKLEKSNKKCLDDDVYRYRQLLGSLMYLSVCTRPDISYACSQLSMFNTCFDENHWRMAKRVLRYLAGTINYGLCFTKGVTFNLTAYADASWANDLSDRKSYTGFVIQLGSNVINWESRKQRCISLSSCESEYVALGDCCKDICFVRNFLLEIIDKTFNVVIYNDSQSAQKLLLVKEHSHKRTKHIDLRYHFIKDLVQKGNLNVKYLQTEKMVADVLTKPLCAEKHYKFIAGMNVKDLKSK
jgi:hypothetical protein